MPQWSSDPDNWSLMCPKPQFSTLLSYLFASLCSQSSHSFDLFFSVICKQYTCMSATKTKNGRKAPVKDRNCTLQGSSFSSSCHQRLSLEASPFWPEPNLLWILPKEPDEKTVKSQSQSQSKLSANFFGYKSTAGKTSSINKPLLFWW